MLLHGVVFAAVFAVVSAQPKCADNATITHITELEAQSANLTDQLKQLNQQPAENATLLSHIQRTRDDIQQLNATISQLKNQRQDLLEGMARASLMKDANFTLFSMGVVNKRLKYLLNQTEAVQRETDNLNASSTGLRNEYNSLDEKTRALRANVTESAANVRNTTAGLAQDRSTRNILDEKLKAIADNIALACARLRNYIGTDLPGPCRAGGNGTNGGTNNTVPSNVTIPPPAVGPNVTAARNVTVPTITNTTNATNPRVNRPRGRRAADCVDRDQAMARENQLVNDVANLTETITQIKTARHANTTMMESQDRELTSTLNRLLAEKELADTSLAEARAENQTGGEVTANQLLEYLPLAQELDLKGLNQNLSANFSQDEFKSNLNVWHQKWLDLEANVSLANATLADKRMQYNALQQELTQMRTTLQQSNGTISSLLKELESNRNLLNDYRQQYNASQQVLRQLNETVAKTQAAYDQVQKKIHDVVPHISSAGSTGANLAWLVGVAALFLFRA